MKNDAIRRRAGGVKLSSIIFCVTVLAAGLPARGAGTGQQRQRRAGRRVQSQREQPSGHSSRVSVT